MTKRRLSIFSGYKCL